MGRWAGSRLEGDLAAILGGLSLFNGKLLKVLSDVISLPFSKESSGHSVEIESEMVGQEISLKSFQGDIGNVD